MCTRLAFVTSRCWDMPFKAVVSVQPYATLGGVGLSLDLAPRVSSSIGLDGPVTDAAVGCTLVHLGVDALLEYCEGPGSGQVPDVLRRIGELNTVYMSVEVGGMFRGSRPAHVGVELVRSPLRGLDDVRLSVYGEDRRPLVSCVATGPPKGAPVVDFTPLSPPSSPAGGVTSSSPISVVGAEHASDVITVAGVQPSSVRTAYLSQSVVVPSTVGAVEVGAELPPWVVQAAVWDMMESTLTDLGLISSGSLSCVASHITTSQQVICDVPFELRASHISVHPQYFSVPWSHRIGMPTVRGHPCCEVLVDVIQGDVACVSGRLYFSW